MLPALRNVVAEKERPIPTRSSALFGRTYPHGNRSAPVSGGVKTTSCQSLSKWRSYQATYSSTTPRVAGCSATSSIQPSPTTQTFRPSRKACRYSAPVLIHHSHNINGEPTLLGQLAPRNAQSAHATYNSAVCTGSWP